MLPPEFTDGLPYWRATHGPEPAFLKQTAVDNASPPGNSTVSPNKVQRWRAGR